MDDLSPRKDRAERMADKTAEILVGTPQKIRLFSWLVAAYFIWRSIAVVLERGWLMVSEIGQFGHSVLPIPSFAMAACIIWNGEIG